MIVWITADPFGALTPAEEQAAADAGAERILHGIPPALADIVAAGTLGAVEVPDPEPTPAEEPIDRSTLVAALDELGDDPTAGDILAALRSALG